VPLAPDNLRGIHQKPRWVRFGSGWAWLVSHEGKNENRQYGQPDNPMMIIPNQGTRCSEFEFGKTPIILNIKTSAMNMSPTGGVSVNGTKSVQAARLIRLFFLIG